MHGQSNSSPSSRKAAPRFRTSRILKWTVIVGVLIIVVAYAINAGIRQRYYPPIELPEGPVGVMVGNDVYLVTTYTDHPEIQVPDGKTLYRVVHVTAENPLTEEPLDATFHTLPVTIRFSGDRISHCRRDETRFQAYAYDPRTKSLLPLRTDIDTDTGEVTAQLRDLFPLSDGSTEILFTLPEGPYVPGCDSILP